MELHGWLAAKNMNIDCLGTVDNLCGCMQYNNLLNKFPKDKIYVSNDRQTIFMDGYIVNKAEFCDGKAAGQWQENFVSSFNKDIREHLLKLRGGFCGYCYDRPMEKLYVYTDHTSNKAVYYYADKNGWMLSSCIAFMVQVLKANNIKYHFNETAAKYMLTYGFMLDGSTFVKEIQRVLPGQYIVIKDGKSDSYEYYTVPTAEQKMSEEEAIERIDTSFRRAVSREFDKDKEYGYKHLVDMSGGLDSRMVSWVANDMGYLDQTNMSYSKLNYIDEKISGRVAKYLGHEYVFKSLDDAKWMYDFDEIMLRGNGAANYLAITGGNRMLKMLNTEYFGIEHTGMQGGATLSSYYKEYDLNYAKPQYGYNRYSDKLDYAFDPKILEKYPTQEAFVTYTRGFLGTQSSYIIRQNYLETASPFLDVDFMDEVFRIPFEYRKKRYIYIKWLAAKYPKAAEFGWEKWGGIKPKESCIPHRKVRTARRLLYAQYCKMRHIANKDSMNPEDYWYDNNIDIQKYLEQTYMERIKNPFLSDELFNDMSRLFTQGDITDKSMVLTVLSAIYLYF